MAIVTWEQMFQFWVEYGYTQRLERRPCLVSGDLRLILRSCASWVRVVSPMCPSDFLHFKAGVILSTCAIHSIRSATHSSLNEDLLST